MGRGLTYRDAVRILGDDSKVLKAIDGLAGGLLLAATAGGSELALGLFDAKSEFVKLTTAALRGLTEHMSGMSRFSRSERMWAAHSMIVVISFFETVQLTADRKALIKKDLDISSHPEWRLVDPRIVDEISEGIRRRIRKREKSILDKASSRERLELLREPAILSARDIGQILMATGAGPKDSRLRSLTESLLLAPLPSPSPNKLHSDLLAELSQYYDGLAEQYAWTTIAPDPDIFDPGERARYTSIFREWAKKTAMDRYQNHFLSMVTDFPEVRYWSHAADLHATQNLAQEIRVGVSGLQQALMGLTGLSRADAAYSALSIVYEEALKRPIVDMSEVSWQGMNIPALADSYIDPVFQVSMVSPDDPAHKEEFWASQGGDSRGDLQDFIIGHILSREAFLAPLVVLGQPGSGKSVLTKALAGSLPAQDFLTVRIVLRDISADADIQSQIEQAIYAATGERVDWPELCRRAAGTTPVLVFDGFDELLQVTGVSQSDYIERLARFQEMEALRGRPCATILTSRIAVANRARVPTTGCLFVRLEPFTREQIAGWIQVWNRFNAKYFADRSLRELSPSLVYSCGDLAHQPLLLLMLALYDADENALRAEGAGVGQASLYERLLRRFAEREVRKRGVAVEPNDFDRSVEEELSQLSTAALAMFNRGRQWASEEELADDLLAINAAQRSGLAQGFGLGHSGVQSLLGKFFFIHASRAVIGGTRHGTIEFLHATFGEYLAARVLVSEVDKLFAADQLAAKIGRGSLSQDDWLYFVASWAPVCDRETVIDFLRDLLRDRPNAAPLARVLCRSFASCIQGAAGRHANSYQPTSRSKSEGDSVYLLNLLVLILILSDSVNVEELFYQSDNNEESWNRLTLYWRSRLPREAFDWLASNVRTVRAEVGRQGTDHRLVVEMAPEHESGLAIDLRLPSRSTPGVAEGAFPVDEQLMLRREAFSADADSRLLLSLASPVAASLPGALSTLVVGTSGNAVHAGEAVIRLLLLSSARGPVNELTAAYEDCFDVIDASSNEPGELGKTLQNMVLKQLGQDLTRLPGPWRVRARERVLAIGERKPAMHSWVSAVMASLGLRRGG